MIEGSQQEALLAVSLYNQVGDGRRLEAFFVHMHLAWLYLFHARFKRDGIDFRCRLPNGRFDRVDGEPKTWSLAESMSHGWKPADDPVRKNLELTVALRNKIEHRYEEAISHYVAGYAQALLFNYEAELVERFGSKFSLGQKLRFPVFLNALTAEGVAATLDSQRRVPSKMRAFVAEFESALDPDVTNDHRYDFRIHLVPQLAPKSEADVALRFFREEELTEDQREAFLELGKTGRVIVRERLRDVANLGLLKPSKAAELVESRIPFKFSVYGPFLFAWKKLGVRPPTGDLHPEQTDERYCVYDSPHNDYLYKPAYIEKLVRECSTREGYEALVGRPPVLK